MRVHTGQKSFHCTVCLKTFCTKQSLQNHMNIHYGVQPHACTSCDKQYRFQANLIQHRRRVHGWYDRKG